MSERARERAKVYLTEQADLAGAAFSIVFSAALTAALGGGGVGAEVSRLSIEVPVCSRCAWHCRVHEIALWGAFVMALVGGFVLTALLGMTVFRMQGGFNVIKQFLLPFLAGAVVGGVIGYILFSLVLAHPARACASRWPPVWCAESKFGLEFSFSNPDYAKLFWRGNKGGGSQPDVSTDVESPGASTSPPKATPDKAPESASSPPQSEDRG